MYQNKKGGITMEEKNIICELWQEAERKKDHVKIWGKIYQWLNGDNLSGIELLGTVFYFQKTSSYSSFPNYIYNYLIKWGEKRGYTYLYKLEAK